MPAQIGDPGNQLNSTKNETDSAKCPVHARDAHGKDPAEIALTVAVVFGLLVMLVSVQPGLTTVRSTAESSSAVSVRVSLGTINKDPERAVHESPALCMTTLPCST